MALREATVEAGEEPVLGVTFQPGFILNATFNKCFILKKEVEEKRRMNEGVDLMRQNNKK